MQLKKLDNSFYIENTHLKEALDNFDGNWQQGKVRGYGIVIININSLTFAIPLRSNIKHSAAYITVKSKQNHIKGKGLDFSKSLLITDSKYISKIPFSIPKEEHKTLANKEYYITQKFTKHVLKYCNAIKVNDKNILNSNEYRFTTLSNYHIELKLSVS